MRVVVGGRRPSDGDVVARHKNHPAREGVGHFPLDRRKCDHALLAASSPDALLRLAQKFYETKQYKKGLKSSETILKKFPEHGGTERFASLALVDLH